jgi:hypothetical protein
MDKELLSITVGAPLPEDDAAGVYADIAGKRDASALDSWFNDLVSDGSAPAAPAGQKPAQEGAQGDFSVDDLGLGDKPAPAAGGAKPAAGVDPLENAAPGEPVWTNVSDMASSVFSVAADVGGGVSEAPRQAVGGVIDALGEIDQFMQSVLPIGGAKLFDKDGNFAPGFVSNDEMVAAEKLGEDLFSMIAPDEADTVTGGFVRSTTQFLTGFLPAAAAIGAAAPVAGGAGLAAAIGVGAGALADLVVFDPHEDRLSTFLNEIPALEAIVPDYLADNNPENEGEWEGRLKNSIEGLGLGLAADGLFKAFRYYKAARKAKALGQAEADPVGAHAEAARDELKAASREELLVDVPDEALAPLGDPSGPLLVEAKPDETLVQATDRMKAATARAELSVTNGDALAKINAVREKFTARAQAAGRDPMDEMLDELRSGAVSAAKLPARPVSAILRELGGIDPTSSLAGDLRSRGITAKSFPGLFSKKGKVKITAQGDFSTPSLRSLDNLPAVEHPLFAERGLVDDATGYIPEQAWIDGLEAELQGNPWRLSEDQAKFDDLIGPIEDLDEQLSRLNIDYENMSNEAVKARLKAIDDEEAILRMQEETPPNLGEDLGEGMEPEEIAARDGSANPPAPMLDETGKPIAGKVYINHARINSADDVKAVIQQMADLDEAAIKDKTRGVVSNEQTIKESAQEYRDLNDLLGRAPGPMSAAKAVAARRLLVSSGEQIVQLAKKAQAPDASKADLYNFRRAMAVHYAIQSEVVAARTETARALQSWAIPAGATKARTQAISDLIASTGGAGDLQALAKAVGSVADNPTGLNTMARELGRGRFGKAMYQVWINGLLSSPKTHAVNIMSNAMVSLYAIPERYMSSVISNAFYDGEIKAAEAAAQSFGMVKGIRDGMRLVFLGNKAEGVGDLSDVFDAFVKTDQMHGNAISAESFGLKPEGGIGWGIDMLGKIVNAPGSALGAEDKFFKSIGYRMELNSLAYRQAASEGLEGKEFAGRVADILNNPPESLKVEAIDAAHYNTFTQPLGKQGQAMQLLLGRVPGARLVVPFLRTPTNIMKYTFARTPLAYLSGKIRADIAAGGARAAQAHARVALGSMIMLTVMDMTAEDTITGAGPLDPKLKSVKMNSGWMPYSIKVGNRWVQYSRTDPIGMVIGLGADMSEILANADDEEGGRLVTAGVVALANNLASKTYMSGIFDFIGAIDPSNPTSDPGAYLQNFAGGIVPFSSFLRNTAGAADPMLRDNKTAVYGKDGKVDPVATYLEETVRRIKKGIPGLSDELPVRRDLWGEDIDKSSGLGWGYDFISPLASRVDDPDPVEQIILENSIRVSSAPRIINGVKLSGEEYADFVREAGRPAKEYLDQLVKTPGFKGMSDGPDGMKAEVIKDVINNFRDRARGMLMQRHPKLRERALAREQEKRRVLTGQ